MGFIAGPMRREGKGVEGWQWAQSQAGEKQWGPQCRLQNQPEVAYPGMWLS